MSSALAVQLCRIVAPEKLPDRFLTSGIFTHEESHDLENQVILTYIFEVTRPMFASSTLLEGMVATLQAEHAKLNLKDNLDDQFELVLRQVNQQLNTISESGETDWIGNLNGLIMVMTGEELHFAQTGRCPAYLLQNNRIRQITDDPQPDHEPHPLKTFSNLASGHLLEGDNLLIANQELYNEISLDALRRIVNNSTPYEASQAIAKQLKREKNPAVTSFILQATTTLSQEPTVVSLEEEMQSGFMRLKKQLAPLASAAKKFSVKAGEVGASTAKQTGTLMKDKVLPKTGELLHKGAEKAKALTEQVTAKYTDNGPHYEQVVEVILSKQAREQAELDKIAADAEARLDDRYEEEEPYNSVIPANELALDSTTPVKASEDHSVNLPVILDFAKTFFLKTLPRLLMRGLAWLITWLKVHRNKKIAALVIAVVLLGGTILGVLHRNHNSTATTATGSVATDTVLAQVTELEKKIATAIDLKQNIEAGKDIEEARSKLLAIQNPSGSQQKKLDTLWDSLTTKADVLDNTTRLTTTVASYTLPGDPETFISQLPYFYGSDTSKGALLRTGKGDASQVNGTFALNKSEDSIISMARSTESDAVVYALTKQNKVYRIVQSDSDTSLHTVQTQSGDFDIGDAIGTYAGNVYILDGKTGLLWRYLNNGDGTYQNRQSVIDGSKYDIRKSISLSIDGAIYILKDGGSLMKFSSGKQDSDFTLKDQPFLDRTLINPLQVITNETTPSIYILDGGTTTANHSTAKVLEFSKTGSFIREYAFPKDYTKVKAFDINVQEKKLWILNGSDIKEFDI